MANISEAYGTLKITTENKNNLINFIKELNELSYDLYFIGIDQFIDNMPTDKELEEIIDEHYSLKEFEMEYIGRGRWTIKNTMDDTINDIIEKIKIDNMYIQFKGYDCDPDAKYIIRNNIRYSIENSEIVKEETDIKEIDYTAENLIKYQFMDKIYDFTNTGIRNFFTDNYKNINDALDNICKDISQRIENIRFTKDITYQTKSELAMLLDIDNSELDNIVVRHLQKYTKSYAKLQKETFKSLLKEELVKDIEKEDGSLSEIIEKLIMIKAIDYNSKISEEIERLIVEYNMNPNIYSYIKSLTIFDIEKEIGEIYEKVLVQLLSEYGPEITTVIEELNAEETDKDVLDNLKDIESALCCFDNTKEETAIRNLLKEIDKSSLTVENRKLKKEVLRNLAKNK